jgi:hypothetical protein
VTCDLRHDYGDTGYVEVGEVPSRAVVGRLVGRTLSIAVAVFAAAGTATFFFEYFGRHDFDSSVLPFGGWQVDLTVAGITVLGLALLIVGSIGMRRFRPLPETPRSFQVIAAFVAIVLGAAGVRAFHHQPERVYNWASAYTGSAHRFEDAFARQTLSVLGDATHPPTLRNPGSPATSEQSKPLLVPGDLGPDWRYAGTPPDTVGQPTAPGLEYAVRTFLTAERWNGTLWIHDQDVVESADRYTTAADARHAVSSDIHTTVSCSFPGPCTPDQTFTRSRIADLDVWQESESDPHALNALILDGRSTVLVFGTAPSGVNGRPPLTRTEVLRAAIRRLEHPDRSK